MQVKHGFAEFDLATYNPAWLTQSLIHPELILRFGILPLQQDNDTLHIGMINPHDQEAISTIQFHANMPITIWQINAEKMAKIIEQHDQAHFFHAKLATTLSKIKIVEQPSPLLDATADEPITVFVNQLLQDATTKKISDIHLEPQLNQTRLRMRHDGILHQTAMLPAHLAERVITRLKIMGEMDIAEKRIPQDGRIHLMQPKKMDIRINSCPTIYGEKLVLRLLNTEAQQLHLHTLGFTESQLTLVLNQLQQSQGLILVTGPTGSGKTITLYAMLQHLNSLQKNIVTIEDPVEIELPGINQTAINPQIGLTFAVMLRALLRQDPDIMMVGEIRDTETAKIALEAAQTGHLVIATLHANNTLDTFTRLQTLNIPIDLLANTVSLVIAQRLLRKLCLHCNANIACEHCHRGYDGRIGAFECLPLTAPLANLLKKSANPADIDAYIAAQAWPKLHERGMQLVKTRISDMQEFVRVMGLPHAV